MADLPLKAYAVIENNEGTGGIFFARHAITARKAGANEYGDGELSYVRCNRAPWADKFADTGRVPASLMVWHGWYFECSSCGRKINEDLSDWKELVMRGDTFADAMRLARKYRKWTSDSVIGFDQGAVFCDQECHDDHVAHEAERKRRQDRAIAAFKRIVLKRFPDAKILPDEIDPTLPAYRRHHHAYAEKPYKGRWRLKQISVSFEFPGMQIAPATLRYDWNGPYRLRESEKRDHEARRPHFTCCNGDREAFEAWAARKDTPHAR